MSTTALCKYKGCIDTTGSAIRCNTWQPGEKKPPKYAAFATPCKPLQRLMDHS